MSEPHTQERPYPDNMYIAAPTMMKSASVLVFVVCMFSLAISLVSGFNMVQPFIALITAVGCVAFYLMGMVLAKKERRVGPE